MTRKPIKVERQGAPDHLPELKGYVEAGILHPIRYLEYLPEVTLPHRVVLPLMRYGYLYVEDLLGTKAYQMTVAFGPEPPPGLKGKNWYWYHYQPSWEHIPRISRTSLGQILNSLASWKEMMRQQKGKTVAAHSRVPI